MTAKTSKAPSKRAPTEAQKHLWINIEKLLLYREGEFSFDRLAKLTGVAKSTLNKSSLLESATGLDKVEKIAKAFGLETWQLFVPNLDPANLPVNICENQRSLLEKIKKTYAEMS